MEAPIVRLPLMLAAEDAGARAVRGGIFWSRVKKMIPDLWIAPV